MLVERKKLDVELLKARNKAVSSQDLLDQVQHILAKNDEERAVVKKKIGGKSSTNANALNFALLDTDKIFHVDHIKALCIDYRLRFLDSHLFKNEIPEEAITKIKDMEKAHETSLEGFKIMAPSKLFKLKNYDDPLLFVPIGNNYYYLIHKWGNDLNPLRKLMVSPFKNYENIFFTIALFSLLCAFIVPQNAFIGASEITLRIALFLFIFKTFCTIVLYYSFWKGKNFNSSIWNSSYYN